MNRSFNQVRKNRKRAGFTLIELLVVVLILGILIAVAIPLYLTSVRNAGTRTVQANIKTIAQAAQAYRVKNGSYPTATQLAAEGDLQQPVGNMGPTGVGYTLIAPGTSTNFQVKALETKDVFGGAGTDDSLTYDIGTGLYTTGGTTAWTL